MTSPTISASDSIAEAIDALQGGDDRGVVVLDSSHHVVGILTEGDIVRAVRRGTLTEAIVGSVMTGQVRVTTRPLTDKELAWAFAREGTLLVPVVDKERRLLYVQRSREAVSHLLGGA